MLSLIGIAILVRVAHALIVAHDREIGLGIFDTLLL
jgi:hypothetical protein